MPLELGFNFGFALEISDIQISQIHIQICQIQISPLSILFVSIMSSRRLEHILHDLWKKSSAQQCFVFRDVKPWNSGTKAYIKLSYPHCITKYIIHMGGVDILDVMVGVYRIDVCGKKQYWLHYINTFDVLSSVAFKVFKLSNLDVKMDFLCFTRGIVIHYLKLTKLKK